MPQLKAKDVRSLSLEEVSNRIAEYQKEYLRLKTLSARGTIAKESGKIKRIRKTLAMLKTIQREKVSS
ncbi:MAG: 50S ribosomal protein L29 [Nitrososphaerota archaeon]